MAGGLCAVKAFEDEFLFGGIDALPMVGDGEDDGGSAPFCREEDGRSGSGVFGGIFQQIDEDFFDVVGVGDDGRKRWNVLVEIVVGKHNGAGAEGRFDDGVELRGGEGHVDLLRIELSHFDGLGDEAVESIRLLVDDGQQFVALRGAEGRCNLFRVGGVVQKERGGGGFDGGERGPQLVCDGVDHEGAETLACLGGFGARDVVERLSAVERDADEAADGLQRVVGEMDSFDDEQAAGADADADGDARFRGAEVGGCDRVRDGVCGREGESVLAHADLVHGNGGGIACQIAAVAFEQVKQDGVGMRCELDGGGDGIEHAGDIFRLQQLASKAVEHLDLTLAKPCVESLRARSLRKPRADDGSGEKGKEREPVLRVIDDQRADGRQKVIVVKQSGGDGHDDGVTQTPARGQKEHVKQQGESDGGLVDMELQVASGYNSGKDHCRS